MENTVDKNDLDAITLFPTTIYRASAPEFIDVVRTAGINSTLTEEELKAHGVNKSELYPVEMSGDITYDPTIEEFGKYIIQTGFNVLLDQGFDMHGLQTVFQSMWMQEHHKFSGMEQHTHGEGSQLVGFYFIDVPENSSLIMLHDPRPGKVQINLPPADHENVAYASPHAFMQPKAGDLILTNAWLPHSFTRHGSDEPLRFVHINIGVQQNPNAVCEAPTII